MAEFNYDIFRMPRLENIPYLEEVIFAMLVEKPYEYFNDEITEAVETTSMRIFLSQIIQFYDSLFSVTFIAILIVY